MRIFGSVLQGIGLVAVIAGMAALAGWEFALMVGGAALLVVGVLVEIGGRNAGTSPPS